MFDDVIDGLVVAWLMTHDAKKRILE